MKKATEKTLAKSTTYLIGKFTCKINNLRADVPDQEIKFPLQNQQLTTPSLTEGEARGGGLFLTLVLGCGEDDPTQIDGEKPEGNNPQTWLFHADASPAPPDITCK
jgi:hypothetical protein